MQAQEATKAEPMICGMCEDPSPVQCQWCGFRLCPSMACKSMHHVKHGSRQMDVR
jgi:hypothetical protein